MSVFRVKLNNIDQGQLDTNPATASPSTGGVIVADQMDPSIQRTAFVAGARNVYRSISDGITFSDCNYWKRFTFPTLPLSQAFIEVVEDDGAPYVDGEPSTFPYADTIDVLSTDAFTDNYIDIYATYGSYATSATLVNNGTVSDQDIQVKLNGSSSAVFTLLHSQVLDLNVLLSKIAFDGGVSNTTVTVILTIESVCNS